MDKPKREVHNRNFNLVHKLHLLQEEQGVAYITSASCAFLFQPSS